MADGVVQRSKDVLRRLGVQKPWARPYEPYTTSVEDALKNGANHGELAGIFFRADGRLMHKWMHYFAAYEREFAPFREGFPLPDGSRRPLRLLEIGVFHGGSLQLWRTYFGPQASIWGVDIDPRCATVDDGDVHVRIGSQADPGFLTSVVAEMGGVDIVIDDGSHHAKHQRAAFEALFPLLSDGGLYFVEDVHTAYWFAKGGGYRRPGTFIEVAKHLVDGMHAWYYRRRPHRVARTASTTISRLTFYDSIVVVEKRLHGEPMVVKAGRPSF